MQNILYNICMNIGIIYKKEKLKDETVVTHLQGDFLKRGIRVQVLSSYEEIAQKDIVIVLGGDGALLHAARYAAKSGTKVIGINYGTLGFLTEYESKDTDKVVSLICDNRYTVLKRTIMEVRCGEKKAYALNEVSLQRNALAPSAKQLIEFRAEMDGKFVDDILSDGLVVCTPTGSTAYSLSAGGSILSPDVPAFMLTPLCAFSLRSRPIVYSDSKQLSITVHRERDKALLFCDGKYFCEAAYGDKIIVQKAAFTADFIQGGDSNFFEKINSKFGK